MNVNSNSQEMVSKRCILLVWTADYPWDVRVEKVSDSLIAAGFEVHIACRNIDKRQCSELYRGLHIHRLPTFPGVFNSLFTVPFFLNPVWLFHLYRTIKKHNIDLVIVRDLPISPAGVIISSIFSIPCVLDMAEVYPAMWQVMFEDKEVGLTKYFLKNPKLADIIEHVFLKKMAHIWVMVEESRLRLLQQGLSASKISIVGNTPKIKNGYQQLGRHFVGSEDCIKIIYTGVISAMRGLDMVIYAVKTLKEEGVNLQLIVAGDGHYKSELDKIVTDEGLEDEIKMLGWIQHSELPTLLKNSHIGIVSHKVNAHTNTTLPNKLFDYMGFGLPVIVTNATPLERIVNEVGCGTVYNDGDIDSLKAAIRYLITEDVRNQCGEKGYNAYLSTYCWNNDEAVMLGDVKSLLEKCI